MEHIPRQLWYGIADSCMHGFNMSCIFLFFFSEIHVQCSVKVPFCMVDCTHKEFFVYQLIVD